MCNIIHNLVIRAVDSKCTIVFSIWFRYFAIHLLLYGYDKNYLKMHKNRSPAGGDRKTCGILHTIQEIKMPEASELRNDLFGQHFYT